MPIVPPAPCLLNDTCDQLSPWIVAGYIVIGVFMLLVVIAALLALWSGRKGKR